MYSKAVPLGFCESLKPMKGFELYLDDEDKKLRQTKQKQTKPNKKKQNKKRRD